MTPWLPRQKYFDSAASAHGLCGISAGLAGVVCEIPRDNFLKACRPVVSGTQEFLAFLQVTFFSSQLTKCNKGAKVQFGLFYPRQFA